MNGRAGHADELSTKTSTDVRAVPAVVFKAKPVRRNSSSVEPPIVASNRLPASRVAPESIAFPLYQSRGLERDPRNRGDLGCAQGHEEHDQKKRDSEGGENPAGSSFHIEQLRGNIFLGQHRCQERRPAS